jgi:hypothetical protein
MGIPGMIKQGGSMIGDAFSPEGMQRNVNRGTQTLDAMGHAVLPMVDNAANLAMNVLNFRSKVPQVTQEQNRASGNFSGQFAAPLIMGAGLSAAPGAAGSLADAIRNRPTMGNVNAMKANAGANFTKALTAARNIPIDLTEPGNAAMQAQQLGSTGAQLPKVISDYAKYPVDPVKPMTYEIGRDFAKNAGDVAYGERALLNEQMKMHVEDFRRAMNDSNRVAAEKAGVVNEYDAAMKEYAKASNLEERNAIIKKWAGRIAVSAALGGTSGMAAKAAWELFHAK